MKRPADAPKRRDEASPSELFPLLGSLLKLFRKPYVILGALAVVATIFGFTKTHRWTWAFLWLECIILTLLAFLFVYRIAGKKKRAWLLIAVGYSVFFLLGFPFTHSDPIGWNYAIPAQKLTKQQAAIYFQPSLQLLNPIVYDPIDFLSKHSLVPLFAPILLTSKSLTTFYIWLISAGLPEELTKSFPLFLLLFLGFRMSDRRRDLYGISEPLDGIVLGAASGAGFALAENLFKYIPRVVNQRGAGAAFVLGPLRSVDTICGHIAYAGYFGYFIGLAAMRPKRRIRTVLLGYVTAAILHGIWDAFGAPNNAQLNVKLAIGLGSYLMLAAAVVKAREISPKRAALKPSISFGFVRRLRPQSESSGSDNRPLKDEGVVPILDAPPPVPPKPNPIGSGSETYMGEQRYTVGRAKECSLPIADDSVSRVHAEVWFLDPGRIRIRDLDSSNGTTIVRDGRELALGEETVLVTDQIRFGEVTISAQDVMDALRDMASAPRGKDTRGRAQREGKRIVARTNRGRMVRCPCGAVKPIAQACPMCGE